MDLKHRDWLLYSTKRILQQTGAESISIQIVDLPNDRKVLVASGITETMIDNLQFLVNTDQNNNYLYLEDFKVYVQGYFSSLDIPGLKGTVINAFRACDIDNFLLGNKTHTPFSGKNFSSETVTYKTFNEYVDAYSNVNPYTPSTVGLQKTYEIVLNPDMYQLYLQSDFQNLQRGHDVRTWKEANRSGNVAELNRLVGKYNLSVVPYDPFVPLIS